MNPDIFTAEEIITNTIITNVPVINIVVPQDVLNAVGIGIYD
jgi:hypothetical protein